ncbi:unnamed protein product [Brassica rapa]|uniref:Auxin response factor n=1 Tax=Brassica campestris TaxID=3711 RepID=A0A8D9CRY9_BRACM|nr:unnamed protein product [Brassica rapa]
MENNKIRDAQPKFQGIRTDGTNRYMYNQLWKLCAGSLFDLPIIGEEVYYFPQGHIEQAHLVASENDNLCQFKPIFDISSKIRCNVISIKLKVDTNTDEVYAKVSLSPFSPEFEVSIPNGNNEQNINYFTKVLTASDASTHGGFSLFKKDAIECLPLLDMSQQAPSQWIVAKDLHDHVWKFKHTFRGTPQRHLFTSGWKQFVRKKSLAVGDSVVFLRGENGESQIGIRKAAPQQSNISSSVISKESMHYGLVATASNAINSKCMFDVFYRPKSSKFIVNCKKVIDAVNMKFNTGSRFTMKFEGRDFNEIIYSGTIVKVEDFSIYWKDSEWRNLQVQWDEAATISRPNKVSPWEIEPLIRKNKRQREINEIGKKIVLNNLCFFVIKSSTSLPQLIYQNETNDSKISSGWLVSYAGLAMSKPYYNDQMVQSTKENSTTNASSSFRLFGVDLTASTKARDVLEPLESYQKSKISEIFDEEKLDQIQAVTSLTEIQTKKIRCTTSSTKVHMEGVVRTVDLTDFDGYNHMILELEKLFNIEGKLHMHSQWKLTFKVHEGDMMLVGDDSWLKFCNTVKEIFICSK